MFNITNKKLNYTSNYKQQKGESNGNINIEN